MNSPHITYSLGPLEREVLKVIWNSNKVCVRHVLEQLPQELKPAYTTVMTIMNRMVEKGILVREKPSTTCYYQTRQSKKEFLTYLAKDKITTFINHYGKESIPILKESISSL
jgi:predicted transcriptional regulator